MFGEMEGWSNFTKEHDETSVCCDKLLEGRPFVYGKLGGRSICVY